MLITTDLKQLDRFFNCITTHFMNDMGARNSCSGDSVRSDNDTNVENTRTLLSKDRPFYNFIVERDTLSAGNICPATDDTCDI